jgi:acetolactate synthase small subunit
LYQVWSLIRTLDDTARGESSISTEQLVAQVDRLILDVIGVLEGAEESEIVRHLLGLRNSIAQHRAGAVLTTEAEAARQRVINIVNNFFHDRLVAIPPIRQYMESLQG